MKVLLTTLNSKYIHTNLAIRILKSVASDSFDIDIAEYTIKDDLDKIIDSIMQIKPHVIGFSIYIWNINKTTKLINKLKVLLPNTIIIVGGPEVSYDVRYFLNEVPAIDYIISGEGEFAFKELLETIYNKKKIDIASVSYRLGNELIINQVPSEVDLKALEEYPSFYRYENDKQSLKNRITYFETSRGCPYNCQYCLSSLEKNVRHYNIEFVKSELLYLINNNVRMIKFLDRTFNVNIDYALEVFDFIIKNHKPNQQFQFEITGEILSKKIINYLNQHAPKNLFRFEIGIQSTYEPTNKAVKRHQNWRLLKENIELIQKGNKIDLHLDLIAGLPHEDYDRFKITFNDVFSLRPKELQLGFLKMLRGTGLRNNSLDWGYTYDSVAPYEIIKSDVLSTKDIYNIKITEEALEKFWNSNYMPTTLNYIMDNITNPFDFFFELGTYYMKRWQWINYQVHDIYIRFYDYIKTTDLDLDIILSLLKHDYLLKHKIKPKIWWDRISKEERKEVYKYIIENDLLPLNQNEVFKYSILEKVPIDIYEYISNNIINKKEQFLLVSYKNNKAKNFFINIKKSID